jgi:hypothetical protein
MFENMNYEEIYRLAVEEGKKAALALTPIPMVVSGYGQEYFVADGVCGFAWVNIRPGTSSFAKWLVKQGIARKSYYGGVDIWISDYGQSMQKKEAHAYAVADFLKAQGIIAQGMSRMD